MVILDFSCICYYITVRIVHLYGIKAACMQKYFGNYRRHGYTQDDFGH